MRLCAWTSLVCCSLVLMMLPSGALAMSDVFDVVSRVIPRPLFDRIMAYMPAAMSGAERYMHSMLRSEAGFARRYSTGRAGAGPAHGFKFVAGFLGGSSHTKQMSFPAFMQTTVLRDVRSKFSLSNEQTLALMAALPPVLKPNQTPHRPDSTTPMPGPDTCPYPQHVLCDAHAPYRTADGTCNNLGQPLIGSVMQPLSRFVPPEYADAISAPRASVTGHPLPSARLVSTTIHWDIDLPHHVHTLMLMQLGQILDHDLSRTAISKLNHGEETMDVECGSDGCQTHGHENAACLPIPVPRNDTVYGPVGKPCLMFVRSQEVPYSPNCRLGPREQLNQLTSWMDASHVYGSTKKETDKLRDLANPARGRLLMTGHPAGNYKNLLPKDPTFKDCKNPSRTVQCFAAGDGRVNEFMGLTCLHTLFAREHNRIEADLFALNPHWNGEKLFQEAKRIFTAKWQYIVYNEFLPMVLGEETMNHQGLTLLRQGYWNAYDPTVDSNIANVFATAAFRFGHSLIPGVMEMKRGGTYETAGEIPLSTMFRTPHMLYTKPDEGMDALMHGIIGMHGQTRDPFIAKELSTQLFAKDPPTGHGEDLMSLNLQRGREHGLPGYNTWRGWCGLKRATHFADFADELPAQVIERLKRLYTHVDDVDLWSAGISEFSLPGAVLGPTFACIIARQFKNLKYGDRFWFENNVHNPHPFSTSQLQEIRKASLARMICANSDSVAMVQPRVLLQPLPEVFKFLKKHGRLADDLSTFNHLYFGTENRRVPCHTLLESDMRAWQDVAQPPPPPIQRPPPPPPRPQQPVSFKPQPHFLPQRPDFTPAQYQAPHPNSVQFG